MGSILQESACQGQPLSLPSAETGAFFTNDGLVAHAAGSG